MRIWGRCRLHANTVGMVERDKVPRGTRRIVTITADGATTNTPMNPHRFGVKLQIEADGALK